MASDRKIEKINQSTFKIDNLGEVKPKCKKLIQMVIPAGDSVTIIYMPTDCHEVKEERP